MEQSSNLVAKEGARPVHLCVSSGDKKETLAKIKINFNKKYITGVMKNETIGSITGTGEILVTVKRKRITNGVENFETRNYTTTDKGIVKEDSKGVIDKPTNKNNEEEDTFKINLNDIKIELNQETTADLEGTDLIKAVWKILGDTINNLKETLTK